MGTDRFFEADTMTMTSSDSDDGPTVRDTSWFRRPSAILCGVVVVAIIVAGVSMCTGSFSVKDNLEGQSLTARSAQEDFVESDGFDFRETRATASALSNPYLDVPVVAFQGVQPGTCETQGCSDHYQHWYPCQCTSECNHFGNCCPDYKDVCVQTDPTPVIQPVIGSLPFGHPQPNKTYPQHAGFTLWLVEEFDTAIDLNTDPIWTYSDGGLSEGKVRFVKDAITFKDGKMSIEIARSGWNQGHSCSHAEVGYIPHKSHTSGEFRTRLNLFRYGRYEVSMRAPTVQGNNVETNGNYIATMFVFRAAKFHHWREIDIEVTGEGPTSVTSNVLKADWTGSWSARMQKLKRLHAVLPSDFNARSRFHTYAFEWLPTSITWFVDNVNVREHRKGDWPPISELSTKVMMNLWVFNGGGFGGRDVWNNRYPMHSEYDWFRFYKWDRDDKYPCLAMDQTCLTEDDQYLTSNNPCDGIRQDGTIFGKLVCRATCNK